jgi:hypothetical protein
MNTTIKGICVQIFCMCFQFSQVTRSGITESVEIFFFKIKTKKAYHIKLSRITIFASTDRRLRICCRVAWGEIKRWQLVRWEQAASTSERIS